MNTRDDIQQKIEDNEELQHLLTVDQPHIEDVATLTERLLAAATQKELEHLHRQEVGAVPKNQGKQATAEALARGIIGKRGAAEVQEAQELEPTTEPATVATHAANTPLDAPAQDQEPDTTAEAATSHDIASEPTTRDQEPDTATGAATGHDTASEPTTTDQEPETATEAPTGHDTASEPTTTDQEPGTTTEATNADDRPLSKLTVEELRQVYVEAVGRPSSSRNVSYLRWKIMQARKGRIPVGPRRQRAATAAGPHRVLPLRMEEDLVKQLDEARQRLGLSSRMELFRRSLHAFLLEAGEVRVAELFAPTTEA